MPLVYTHKMKTMQIKLCAYTLSFSWEINTLLNRNLVIYKTQHDLPEVGLTFVIECDTAEGPKVSSVNFAQAEWGEHICRQVKNQNDAPLPTVNKATYSYYLMAFTVILSLSYSIY